MAGEASGRSGQASDRPGDGIGSKFKDTGAGGRGTRTQGIAGVNTKGKGSGYTGYGTGGLGDKGRVFVTPGGAEEKFIGTIDKEAVRRVVRAGLREVRSCYERELNKKRSIAGKVVIEWLIGEQGRVLKTKTVSNTTRATRLANCVRRRIASWRFPEPPEGVIAEVQYPFVFVSQ